MKRILTSILTAVIFCTALSAQRTTVTGDVLDALNLVDHEENLGRQVFLKGDIVEAYYGIPGLQNITEFELR